MLKLKDVSKYYYQDGVIAQGFSKVNLELHIGEFVVITGESGSGKSTLLNVLSGLDSYEDGEMYINGEETSHYTEEDYLSYRRKYVSNIFQNFNLVNSYSVYDNIELALLMNGYNRKNAKPRVNELIERVGLKKYKHTKTSKLSGGQKQRVAIARALANDTPIIVADEPTGALDSKASKDIIKLLKSISEDKLVIIVTHNKKEVEDLATRLIRMHDGKILENKVVKKVNLDDSLITKESRSITEISKIRLGIRNTFNLPIKFFLMISIFLLITIALITNYGSFKIAENEESVTSFNTNFVNSSDKRIVVSKKNKEVFNNDDYTFLQNVDGVESITQNDLVNDMYLFLSADNLYFGGTLAYEEFDHVDYGRMPNGEKEVVIIGNKDDWYLKNMKEELLDATFTLDDFPKYEKNIKIVGIIYNDNNSDYETKFILSKDILENIDIYLSKNSIKTSLVLNNNYFDIEGNVYFEIKPNDSIETGKVYVKDTFNMYCKYYNCVNKDLILKVNNIYFNDEMTVKIDKVYTKYNTKNLLNLNYDELDNTIFVSNDDYNTLYNRGNFQASVFVGEVKDLEKVASLIENNGYNVLKLRDSKIDEVETVRQIFKIIRLVIIIILIIALFFISYFIIKIIYKSRNSYYTTLRTLGSTKSVCVNILMREIISFATIAFTIFLVFMILVKKDIIKIDYFKELSLYIGIKEYLIVFIIIIIMSILIAFRYGRKIFKDSIIKTYGERI